MHHITLKIVFQFGFVLAALILGINFGPSAVDAQKGKNDVQRVKTADGTSIAYEVRGSGTPALIFVHGWSCDRSYWAGQVERFSRQFKVVAVDLAGHGESGLGRTPEQVQTFLERFRANFKDTTKDFVRDMFLAGSDRALVERVADDMSSAPPMVALAALESAFSYSRKIPRTLEELKLPVIAINPDNAPTDIASMKRYGVEVMIMPGVGHFLHMEDPERFNSLLMAAITKLRR